MSMLGAMDTLIVPNTEETLRRSNITSHDFTNEFHNNTIENWDSNQPQVKRLSVVYNNKDGHKVSEPQGKSHFDNLQSDILLHRLNMQADLDYIRTLAMKKLHYDIIRKLQICYETHICMNENASDIKIPFRMFSWDENDFLNRRKLHNVIWIDVLRMELSVDCLETKKLRNDLEELSRYLNLIFNTVLHKHITDQNVQNLVEYIDKSNNFLHIYEKLERELEKNYNELREDLNKSLAMTITRRDSIQRAYVLSLEETLTNRDVVGPIEQRYQIGFYSTKVNQMEYKFKDIVQKCEKNIGYYNKMLRTESYCSQCALNTYYLEIANFKSRMGEFTSKYDQELEAIDNMIAYKKISLEKLREQKLFFSEQIKRFHEEIENLRIMEILQNEKAERLKEDQLMAKNLNGLTKKKKKKKKGLY